jgi:hypothetical protein
MNTLLKNCRSEIEEALAVFKVWVASTKKLNTCSRNWIETDPTLFNNIDEMNREISSMHEEVLGLISTLSDETISDRSLSVCLSFIPQVSFHDQVLM